jgi:uncharacterized membrane protein
MSNEHHVENPFEFVLEKLSWAASDVGQAVQGKPAVVDRTAPTIRHIKPRDLWEALRKGMGDLGAVRDDILFIALIYPVAGLVLARLASDLNMLPLVFPLASGFALLGPVAAIGLYEISRRREEGQPVKWNTGLSVLRSPALGSILGLGAILLAMFFLWLAAAYGLYAATLGPAEPTSVSGFLRDVFMTGAGWTMLIVGTAVGFLFAVAALAISVISFPLLLDRDVGIGTAVATSVRAITENPWTMSLWGLIVAGALILGSIPALVGLIFVMPVLGHATWHLYRKVTATA